MSSACLSTIAGLFATPLQMPSSSEKVPSFAGRVNSEKDAYPVDKKVYQAASHSELRKDSSIIVVGGGGTMGSSTALHLARRGYTDVRILDVFEIPSLNSAGNDMNKICTNSTADTLDGYITRQAMDMWKHDPTFAPYLHHVGRSTGAHNPAQIEAIRAKYESAVVAGKDAELEWLDTPKDILRRMSHLKDANLEGSKALWHKDAGWLAAREALDSVGRELHQLGVKMSFGPTGTLIEPILSIDGTTVIGVLAADGTQWYADRVVMATGAWTPTLVDLQGQCVSKCWVYAHLQLTPSEVDELKEVPVYYDDQLGFFIAPSPRTGLMKLCNEFPGYTRKIPFTPFGSKAPGPQEQEISVPRSHFVHPTDTMPDESLDDIKRLIKKLLPRFEGRELVGQACCWCTDTPDARWLFCEHPSWKGLYMATGDSGHSFMSLPIVGSYIVDMLEGKLTDEMKEQWGWRPGHGDPLGIGRPGPPPKDLKDLDGWKHDDRPASDI